MKKGKRTVLQIEGANKAVWEVTASSVQLEAQPTRKNSQTKKIHKRTTETRTKTRTKTRTNRLKIGERRVPYAINDRRRNPGEPNRPYSLDRRNDERRKRVSRHHLTSLTKTRKGKFRWSLDRIVLIVAVLLIIASRIYMSQQNGSEFPRVAQQETTMQPLTTSSP